MRHPRPKVIIYDNKSEVKSSSEHLCDSFGVTLKPTTINNQQSNSIPEQVHQTIMNMSRTAELDMRDSALPEDVEKNFADGS